MVRERSGDNIFLEKSEKMKNWCQQMSDFQAKMHDLDLRVLFLARRALRNNTTL